MTNIVDVPGAPFRIQANYTFSIKDADTILGTILFFHGSPGLPILDYQYVNTIFNQAGFHYACANYPGIWGAKGFHTVEHFHLSAKAQIEYFVTKDTKLYLHGHSFGGIISLDVLQHLPSTHSIQAILLQAPAFHFNAIKPLSPEEEARKISETKKLINQGNYSYPGSIQEGMKELRRYYAQNAKNRAKIIELVEELQIPIFVIFGANDQVIQEGYTALEIEKFYQPFAQVQMMEDLPHNNQPKYVSIIARAFQQFVQSI